MLVLLNPAARGGAGLALRSEIRRELDRRGVAHELVLTGGPGHATELARTAAADGVAVVVAAGGDGTLHEVANGLLQAADAGSTTDPALGLIPIGTGNDFVKVVPGTSSRSSAYDTLAGGEARRFDAALASWEGGREYYLNAAGTGVDVEVVRQLLRMSRRTGSLTYIGALVRALRGFRPVHLRLEADGETLEQRVMTIAVSNGACIGGLFHICPAAVPHDGLLDLCVVAELPWPRIPPMALRLVRGRHAGQPGVVFRRVRQVRVRVLDGSPLFFQLDGELREPLGVEELELTVQPGRLRVLAARVPAARAAAVNV